MRGGSWLKCPAGSFLYVDELLASGSHCRHFYTMGKKIVTIFENGLPFGCFQGLCVFVLGLFFFFCCPPFLFHSCHRARGIASLGFGGHLK